MKLIEKLTYINDRGDSITFSSKSQYHVNISKDVTGLSDVQNEIYSIKGMGQDGETGVGNRIKSRDIEIVGKFRERDKTARQKLRHILNNVTSPEHEAILIHEYGNIKRVIDCELYEIGYSQPDIYEQFVLQITGLNPYWRDEAEIRNDIAVWVGGFEFPIRDENDQPDGLDICSVDGIEVGYREPSTIINVENNGDARAGLRVDFRALGTLSNPKIFNVEKPDIFILVNIAMIAGDIVTVNTGYNQKSVTRTRNGVVTDIFRHLDADSTYIQLAAGDNLFQYDASSGVENLEVSTYHQNNYLSGA
jgi:hypothetical protein